MVGDVEIEGVGGFPGKDFGARLESRESEDLQERIVVPEVRPWFAAFGCRHANMQKHKRDKPGTALPAWVGPLSHRYRLANGRGNAALANYNANTSDAGISHMRMLLLAFLVFGTGPPAAVPEPLPEFEATYGVRYGLLGGTLVLRLSRHGSSYVYETSLQPKGLVSLFARGTIRETTKLIEHGATISPVDYVRTDTIANPPRTTRYFFHDERVEGTYKGQQIEVPMQPGGHNRISVHIALMYALRRSDDIGSFTVFDRSSWKEYRLEVVPGQLVKTKSGTFDTIEVRYSSPGDEKNSSLYFAPSLEFLPVMIVYGENGKVKSRAHLTDYRIAGTRREGMTGQKPKARGETPDRVESVLQ